MQNTNQSSQPATSKPVNQKNPAPATDPKTPKDNLGRKDVE